MKPINLDESGCNPISSKCVIWEGPDIECIKLCKGDKISDVVAKLANELCEILDQLNVDAFELTCFDLCEGEPKDFQALIQLLIDKICACCEAIPDPEVDPCEIQPGCPDCIVDICEKFWFTNPQGDLVKQMQLQDYVIAIGNKVCDLITEIATIQVTLVNHNTRITNLELQFPIPPTPLPNVTPPCPEIGPVTPTAIDTALLSTMQLVCTQLTATGSAIQINNAAAQQCAGLGGLPQLSNPGSNMSTLTGWEVGPASAAQAITNLWLTICDMRAAVGNILINCCDTGCDGINILMTATLIDENTITIYFTGVIPTNLQTSCYGNQTMTIEDSAGNIWSGPFNLISVFNNALGFTVDLTSLSVNGNLVCTVDVDVCLKDTVIGTQCQSQLSAVAFPDASCPGVTYTPAVLDPTGTVSYELTWTIGIPGSVQIALFAAPSGGIALTSATLAIPANGVYTGDLTGGLSCGTTYYAEVTVLGPPDLVCPRVPVTMDPCPCCVATLPTTTWL